ncbi:MAG: elongation factor P [Deltaproteobacteria bacterium]|nr:elongation factor P [Deltaproteobacteria bacterium]
MYDSSDIRKNLKILLDGQPYVVVDFQFVKPGKGTAFTRTRVKNMITGAVLDKTFRSGEKLEPAEVEQLSVQYMYHESDQYWFMDTSNYEQFAIGEAQLGDQAKFLTENLVVSVTMFKGQAVDIELPTFIEVQITKCEPGVRGDTASGGTKPATISSGALIQVPFHINENDWVKVDTRDGRYVERVNKR